VIPAYAFYGCSSLKNVKLSCPSDSNVTIGSYAFANCSKLENFDLNGRTVSTVGDYAFSNCVNINNLLADPNFKPVLGINVFENISAMQGAVVKDGILYTADGNITSSKLPEGVTAIGPYAFSDSVLANGVNTIDLSNVTSIGTGAFYGLYGLTQITLPAGLTEIPDNAFRGTAITSIVIPASVKSIGRSAFAGCSSLASVTFADGSQLTSIGANAFDGTAITSITLPDGVKTIGGEAFANCSSLVTAEISSVTSMGRGVFAVCPMLKTATFGANATTTGTYTFFAGNTSPVSALTTVELSDKILSIGEGVFARCTELVSIDLKNVTEIGDDAFYGCTKLTTVTGIEKVKAFGARSFYECSAITSLNLEAAVVISYNAFFNLSKLKTVTFGNNLDGIGDEAFAESGISTVTIPASCTYVGVSAFSGATKLYEYVVAAGSETYFTDGGVLYRYIDKENSVYELCAYPAGRTAEVVEGVPTYTVLEGTVTTQSFAFYAITADKVAKVILPYTLKSVGNGAFFRSGITTYQFESIEAPVLLEDVSIRTLDTNAYSHNSFFYNNFVDMLANYAATYPGDTGANATAKSTLTILYPANGTGYDNFVYANYFGTKTELEEMPEDSTRNLRNILESEDFFDADTVSAWKPGGSVTKEDVEAFAAKVTSAHVLYNGLASENQLNYVGQANIDKLFAVEAALKSVKQAFGITVKVSSVALSSNSTHKTSYTAGEKFSLIGLKLIITYDDYSQSEINASNGFRLVQRFDRALRTTDEAVDLEGTGEYAGRTISIRIFVTEGNGSGNGNGSSLNTLAIVFITVGGVALLAIAAVVTVIVLAKKKVIVIKGLKSKEKDAEAEEAAADKDMAELSEENTEAAAENTDTTDNTEIAEDVKDNGGNGEEGNTDD
ncbi:MAG: leucine-rich repeat domain-containing protein, partial [Clostridia bacterium]|nr:leucine-rich repeat domain-containing protein [Clostridia bacterium]